MVLNEALKHHRRCLQECEKKREFCGYDPHIDRECKAMRDACKIDCDFDYTPN